MQTFNIQALNLTDKIRKQLERELPTKDNIVAVMAFSEASVYSNNPRRLDGVLVMTGPVVQTHVFTNAGLTRKYRGTLTNREDGLTRLDGDTLRYLLEHHAPVIPDFRDLCNDVHRAIVEFSKTQLEEKL